MTEPGRGPDTAGGLMRAAREKQGLHIAALAAAIKVTPRKLEALENNRWDELPDATFTRALAQTVCRSLKIDARPVLDLLPVSDPSKLENVAGTLNTPFSERGSASAGFSGGTVRPMLIGGALLLLAALVVYLIPADMWARLSGGEGAVAQPPVMAASEVIMFTPPLMTELTADAASAAASAPNEAASVAAPAASAAPALAEPSAAPMQTAGAGGMMSGDGIQLVIVQSSWIEARDATGRLIVSRLVETGEQLAIVGELPIQLVIGNVAGVELTFKQKRVDLKALTNNNVVRLQLPP